ncbi:MAG: transcription termination/antitermination protein NusA [Candidatus Sungbacteria bacterium]|nr:transcription termination/antitermination protein NusA [Candidatus Sungbacteria bacterium]
MDLKSFTQAIQQIADEKGISRERIFETIEMALASAYKRDYGKRGQTVRASLDPQTGKVTFRQIKVVVDETMIKSPEEIKQEEEERLARMAEETEAKQDAGRGRGGGTHNEEPEEEPEEGVERKVRFNPERHLMLADALATDPDAVVGQEIGFELPSQDDYGRIAAQTAKQVIIQRIREAEREAVFDEYKSKENELVSGLVQRVEGNNVFIDIGRTVGVLPAEEQIPSERYRIGQRIKVLITLVEKNPKGPGVFLSRTHPRLLRELFALEVPEIANQVVEIKSIAREPGSRSKVAVVSHEQGVDPVGSLVGQKGVRVSTVIQELGGEKIDVIGWVEDPARFIANALSPARVLEVLLQDRRKEAQAIVPEDQLSLAIGKAGQNVRLAAKLTGWRIDVRPDKAITAPAEEEVATDAAEETVESAPAIENEKVDD